MNKSLAVVENDIAVYLSGPGFFSCEKYKCRMKKTECVGRQLRMTIGRERKWNFKSIVIVPSKTAFKGCEDCEQGKNIKEEITGEKIIEPVVAIVKPEQKEKSMIDKDKKLCKKCRAPAGKLKRGWCIKCYNAWYKLEVKRKDQKLAEEKSEGINVLSGKDFDIDGIDKEKQQKEEDLKITLNFTKHPELLEQIRKVAEDNFRGAKGQMMYILRENISKLNCTGAGRGNWPGEKQVAAFIPEKANQ